MTRKIFIGNYKGGVGKTTSVFSIADYLTREHGKKVLMLDLDPQSSLSEICVRNISGKGTLILEDLKPEETLNYVFDMSIRNISTNSFLNIQFDLKYLIKQCSNDGAYFIPSSLYYEKNLGLDELSMRMLNSIEYFSILIQFINMLDEYNFDYILIDCPPTSNIITQCAFLASDYYLIPTIEDGISTSGVLHYIKTVDETYNRYCSKENNENYLFNKHIFGEKPKLLGIFYTLARGQVDYSKIRKEFNEDLNHEGLPEKEIYVFKSYTDNYIGIARDIAKGEVSKIVNNKNAYSEITKEIIERLSTVGGD